MSQDYQDGLDALSNHPAIKRVVPHKMVTRTLKYIKGNVFELKSTL